MSKAILGLVLLSACAPTVTQVGSQQYSIERCGSAGACYQEGNNMCPYGFDALQSGQKTTLLVQDYGSAAAVTPITHGELVIQCKPPQFCDRGEVCEPGRFCKPSYVYPGYHVCQQ